MGIVRRGKVGTMTRTIRPAGQDDAEGAAVLLQRFFAEEGFATPPDLIRSRLALMLADATSAVFLAWEGNVAAGVATVTTSVGIELGRSAELDDLYVLPEARGRGCAQGLIAAVRAWCQAHEVTTLSVVVTPEGQDAHDLMAFYRKRGFHDTGRRISSLELTTPSGA